MGAVVDQLGVRGAIPHVDTSDPPFACPPDIVLDIPVPMSVNVTRRGNNARRGQIDAWYVRADKMLMTSGQFRVAKQTPIGERFELTVILCERQCGQDADNPIKMAIDYLRRIEIIKNDDKRYMRRLVVEWGEAPTGCRLILRGAP